MKPFLVLLLVLSLAGNAVLAVLAFRSGAAPTAAVVAATPSAAAPGAGARAVKPATVAEPVNWQTLKPDANLHTLVENLRSAGFPPAVIRALTVQMVNERLSESEADHLPFWKQNGSNPEYLAAQMKLSNQRRDMLKELLGPDARPSLALDPASRERRYGQLSDDKIDQLENMSRDYSELRAKLYAERKPGDAQSMMASQQAVEQEQHTELATILSPTELEQYEMRTSQAANRVMTNLKGFDVNETEFAALYKAQKAYDAADPLRNGTTLNAESMAQRQTMQDQLNEQARAILPDDRFYEYIKGSDPAYARNAQFLASYPTITPATAYEVTQLERSYQTAMMTASRAGAGASPADRMAQLTAARKDYQDKMNALLGADIAAAYAQRNRPAGTTTTAPVRTAPGNP